MASPNIDEDFKIIKTGRSSGQMAESLKIGIKKLPPKHVLRRNNHLGSALPFLVFDVYILLGLVSPLGMKDSKNKTTVGKREE